MPGYSLLKELYDAEWPRRDQLGTSTGVPLAVLTVVASIIAFIAQRIDFHQWISGTLAALMAAMAGVCFGRAVYLLVRSYHGHVYRRIPFPAEISLYEDELHRRHLAVGNKPEIAEDAFNVFLRERYSDAADRNARINAQRGELLFQSNQWMLSAFTLAILAGVPTVMNIRGQAAVVYRVQVTRESTNMADEKTPAPPAPAPAPRPIEPPTAPPNQDLRTEIKKPTLR